MKTWDDWSDDEISSKIMGILHGEQVEHWCLSDCGKYVYDCGPTGDQFYKVDVFDINNWSDIGPLALNSNIVITPCMGSNNGDATGYFEHENPITMDFRVNNKALRAAAIVFLMMNGVKPDEQ